MFRDVFVQILDKKNISCYKLSKETGIPQSSLSDYKTGKTEPTAKNISILADYFGVTVDDLLREDAPAPGIEVTPDEEILLDLFRQVPADKRELVMQMIRVALGK